MSTSTRVVDMVAELCRRLDLHAFTPERLQEASQRVLGPERTARCVEVIAGHRLSRRYFQVGNWAALVAAHTTPNLTYGTDYIDDRLLPRDWWTTPGVYPPYWDMGEDTRVPPDDVLFGRRFDDHIEPSEWRTVLDILAARAQDDTMPSAFDFVDLNTGPSTLVDAVGRDGTRLAVGDRITVTYDPGHYVDAVVTHLEEDRPVARVRCVEGTYRTTFCTAVAWAVSLTLRTERVLLPGEGPGTSTDPYARPLVVTDLVREFLALVGEHDEEIGNLLTPGITLADVHRVEAHRDPARNGTELEVSRALAAVLDDRPDLLEKEMRWLRFSQRLAGQNPGGGRG